MARVTLAVGSASLLALPGCEAPEAGPSANHGADTIQVQPEQGTGVLPAVNPLPQRVLGLGNEHDPPLQRVDIVRTLADGSLVVADAGSLRVHLYGPDGAQRWTAGRPGFGPGEFRTIAGVVPLGRGRLLVFDPSQRRFTVLGVDGDVTAIHEVQGPEDMDVRIDVLRLADRLDGDRVLLLPASVVIWRREAPGPFREDFPLLVYETTGQLVRELGPRWIMDMWGDRRGSMAIPFGRRTLAVAQRGQVFVADNQSGRIDIWGASGALQRSIELQGSPPAVDADDVRRWLETRTSRVADASQRQSRREWLEQVPFPERYPFLEDLRVDHGGRIWLKGARRPGEAEPPIWTILDSSGAPMARVTIPAALRVQEIHEDRIVGVWTDALGLQTVRIYGLSAAVESLLHRPETHLSVR